MKRRNSPKKKKKKSAQQWEYFDDCAVCQAMKRADEQGRELGAGELAAAFRAAGERGAYGGDERREDDAH